MRLRTVLGVLRSAAANPALRRVGFAFALFGTAELGVWIALLIYAYEHGGASASTTMVLVQLVPCMALGPLLGSFTDRHAADRVLRVSYGLQAVFLGALAAAIAAGASVLLVYVLASFGALSITATRPAQAALLPSVVRTPDELTAANVMTGWTFGAASLIGPLVAGLLVAWRGPGLAVAATAVMAGLSFLLVLRLPGTLPGETVTKGTSDPSRQESQETRNPAAALLDLGRGLRANLEALGAEPAFRILLTLQAFYFLIIGTVDLLCVVLAASYVHIGPGGAGYLNASFGGGALLAGFVTAFLVGRQRLKNPLVATLAATVAALGLVSAFPQAAAVIALLVIAGLSGAVCDVTGRTLLQRSSPPDAIAGFFSVLEVLMDLGLVLGALLVRVAIGIGGLRAALLAPAVLAAVLMAILWPRLRRLDAAAVVPQVQIRLLHSLTLFAALPAPTLELIAREVEPVSAPAGTIVFHQGDPGDRYYAVSSGRLSVMRDGELLAEVTRGGGFGEIALIKDVPRRATVTALTDSSLYALRKDLFVQTVTGHRVTALSAGRIIAGHLGDGATDPGAKGRSDDDGD